MTDTTETGPVWRDDNLPPADRLAAIRKRHTVLAARTWEATPHWHPAAGCKCMSCYDDPTGWQIDHSGALDCEELVADTRNDFRRERTSCDAGPLLSYDEADALARAAGDIGFLLSRAAATVPASAPTDQTALRDRIVAAIKASPFDELRTVNHSANGPLQITVVVDDLADTLLHRLADAASGPGGVAGEAPGPWLVHKICCGRDDGTVEFATWEGADRFREIYVDSSRIAGHERSAIVRAVAGEAQRPETQNTTATCPHCKHWYVTSEPGAHEAACPMKPAVVSQPDGEA